MVSDSGGDAQRSAVGEGRQTDAALADAAVSEVLARPLVGRIGKARGDCNGASQPPHDEHSGETGWHRR